MFLAIRAASPQNDVRIRDMEQRRLLGSSQDELTFLW
jgi:hypothetical protein